MSNPSTALEESAGVMRELGQVSDRLCVAQTTLLMALEGMTRVSATEVANRVRHEHSTIVTASKVGIILSGYGVRSVRSGGRSRLVLEPEQLRGVVERLEREADEMAPAVEAAVNKFGDVANAVETLEARVSRARLLALMEQDMRSYLEQYRATISQLRYLEQQHERAQQQVKRATLLQTAIKSLDEQVKRLPGLADREQALQKVVDDHAAAVKLIDRRDREMIGMQARLDQRTTQLSGREKRLAQETAAIDLMELEKTIEERQRELADEVKQGEREIRDLDKQIRSKRSLLDRVLGRDGESS